MYPKDFVPDRLSRSVKVKFQGDDSQGIILADKEKSGVYLFVISNKHGLYLYAIPSSRIYSEEYSDYDAEELKDQLQRKAIAFKASLCSKGGCTKDLGNVLAIYFV